MKALYLSLGSLGVALGIAAAAAWHWWRSSFSGGWTLYSPLNGPIEFPQNHPGWWPTLLLFPVVGALVGTLTAFGLTRFGWALVRAGRRVDER